jgi:hypothetical protein
LDIDERRDLGSRLHPSLAGRLGVRFGAITHAADAIAQKMKNAFHGIWVFGAAKLEPISRRAAR